MLNYQTLFFDKCVEKIKYKKKINKKKYLKSGKFPIISQEDKIINGFWNNPEDVYNIDKPIIIFGDHTRILKYIDYDFVLGADGAKIIKTKPNIIPKYFYYFLLSSDIKSLGYSRHYKLLKKLKLNLPPLPIQEKIVAKLDKIFAEIDKAIAAAEKNVKNSKALYENYLRDVFKKNRNSWNIKYLNEISQNLDNKRRPIKKRIRENGTIPYYGASGVIDYVKDFIFDEDILLISEDGANLLARTYPIVFSVSGKCWVNNHAHVIKFNNIIYQKFVEFYLNSISLKPFISGMAQPKLNQAKLNKIPIPFPSLDQQTKLVTAFNSIKEITNNLNKIYFKKVDEFIFLKQSILQQAFNGELVKAA